MKSIRKATVEFCPFCNKEMKSHDHIELCTEAPKFRMNGLTIRLDMFKDRQNDLWIYMYDVASGDNALVPVNPITIAAVVSTFDHFCDWLGTTPKEEAKCPT